MTSIITEKLTKRYGYNWVIRDFDHTFLSNTVYGISGNNGSGKSTLIKMLCGFLTPSSGTIKYWVSDHSVSNTQIFKHMALAAPYTDLINEFTLPEMLTFHQKFKPFKARLDYKEFEEIIQLSGHKNKSLQHFSSGMKQKIQLALTLLSDTPYLLLDEPTSFLDKSAKKWFENLLNFCSKDRVVIIASNDTFDINLCNQVTYLG